MFRWFKTLAATVAATSFLAACGGGDDPPLANLAQTAQGARLTALVAAADKAGLVSTLADPAANLTVFAPTDTAFTNLATALGFNSATAMVDALPATALRDILLYHVTPGRKAAADLIAGPSTQPTAYQFGGSATTLAVGSSGGVSLTDAVLTSARVTQPNVAASNGIVHVIDKVLVPPGVLNVVQMAQANPAFSSLVGAVASAGLVPTLSGTGPFTVFAPGNDAFAAIASTVATLTPAQLSTVLTYHVVPAEVLSTGIPFGTPVSTVSGQSITFAAGTPPTITDTTPTAARIVATDIRASNGVIHVVDKVLLPTL
jgi:transforming growth factor-beta-induced protein